MEKFSDKFGYSKPNEPITEAAPMWLRIAFLDMVLSKYLQTKIFLDDDEPDNEDIELARFNGLIQMLTCELRQDFHGIISSKFPKKDFSQPWMWKTYLEFVLRQITWYEFYDLVELLGKQLLNEWIKCREHVELIIDDIEEASYWSMELFTCKDRFENYISDVNQFFERNNVRWFLDEDSELQLLFPDELLQGRNKVVQRLTKSGLKTTLTHYLKSERFNTRRPLDPANAIKEIASAIEALGTDLYPDVEKLTLTKMINEMSKTPKLYPKYLLSIMQNFYNYANSEPGARHGKEKPIVIRQEDGEFCFHLGTAILLYITSVKKSTQVSTN